MISRDRREAEEALADIKNLQVSIAEIEARKPHEPVPEEAIEVLKEGVQTLRGPLKRATERYNAVEKEHHFESLGLEKAEGAFNSHAPEPYLRNRAILDASLPEA